MAAVNGGPVRAPEPGKPAPVSFNVSGNFTNSQYVNSNIDCTGLIFEFTVTDGTTDTTTASISDMEYVSDNRYYINLYFPNIGKYAGSYIDISPYTFTTTGEQTVTFSWTDISFSALTATKSVNVQSSSITKNLYAFLADGRKVKIGTIEAAPPVTVTGVTTNIVIGTYPQRSGRFNISYSDGTTSIVYPYSVNTGTYAITYTAETPPGTFTYNHYEPIGVAYQALYYDYTEDGTTISDILMAVAGGGVN